MGRIALNKVKMGPRVNADTPDKIKEVAATLGYTFGGDGAVGELLDAIASGDIILISRKK